MSAKGGYFNRDIWEGRKPLAPKLSEHYGIGDRVACAEPVDSNGNPTIEGVIVHLEVNADGEQVATVARRVRREWDTPKAHYEWMLKVIPVGDLDPGHRIEASVFNRGHVWRIAGEIAEGVGRRYSRSRGAQWSTEDLQLLEFAYRLATMHYSEAA